MTVHEHRDRLGRRPSAGCRPVMGLLLPALLVACTANPLLPEAPPAAIQPGPATAGPDTALLSAIAGLRNGERTEYLGQTLEAGTAYHAASGAICRPVRVIPADGTQRRPLLACQAGEHRYLATDVFAGYTGLPAAR